MRLSQMMGFSQGLRIPGKQREHSLLSDISSVFVIHVLNKAHRPQEQPKFLFHCQQNLTLKH